jgi:hypothetical protein
MHERSKPDGRDAQRLGAKSESAVPPEGRDGPILLACEELGLFVRLLARLFVANNVKQARDNAIYSSTSRKTCASPAGRGVDELVGAEVEELGS